MEYVNRKRLTSSPPIIRKSNGENMQSTESVQALRKVLDEFAAVLNQGPSHQILPQHVAEAAEYLGIGQSIDWEVVGQFLSISHPTLGSLLNEDGASMWIGQSSVV